MVEEKMAKETISYVSRLPRYRQLDETRLRNGTESMAIEFPDTSVIIPTLNEEETISHVVKEFIRPRGTVSCDVTIVDGHSKDQTVKWAKRAGARVLLQKSRGKGMAMVEGVMNTSDSKLCIFVDGDGTYSASDLNSIVKPIVNGSADMVIGSRLKGIREKGSMPPINVVGNKLCTLLVKLFFKTDISDLLSGYRAVKASTFKKLGLKGGHFEIEVEMTVKALVQGLRVHDVPITYLRRRGKPAKLRPFKDGILILKVLLWEILNSRRKRAR